MAFRRGFKAEANWYSREFRAELGLQPQSPLCPFVLARHLELPVMQLSEFRKTAPEAAEFLLSHRGRDHFSAVTIFPDGRRVIIHNESHDPVRQHANLAHEISHAVLQHPPVVPFTEAGTRNINRDYEDEANWMGPALLVSEEAALSIVRRRVTVEQAALEFRVSVQLMRMRIGVTNAHLRVKRSRAA